MMRWLVIMEGADEDLAQLVDWPDGPGWQIVPHERWRVVLCGPRLETANSYDVAGQIADTLIARINRSARCILPHYKGVTVKQILEQLEDGGYVASAVGKADGVGAATAVGTVSIPSGTETETPEDRAKKERANCFSKLNRLQEAHPDLADAWSYLDDEPSMSGFYMAGEAISFAVSGSKNWDALIQLGWTSKTELRRFKWSAQPKRHHRHSGPRKPMTENEAERYVRSLLDKLIAHLGRTTP